MKQVSAAAIRPLTAAEVETLQAAIVGVYRAAFAAPPYWKGENEVGEFAVSLPAHARRAGFCFLAATDPRDGRLAGFGYGYTCAAGQWWHDVVAAALHPRAAEWLEGSFQLAEIAVLPGDQGCGIGGRLHDALLEGLPHHRAVLSTLAAETVARGLYLHRGWVPLLDRFDFPGVTRPYSILGLDLVAYRRSRS